MFCVLYVLTLPYLISCAVISSSDTGNENYRTGRNEEPAPPSKWSIASKYVDDCVAKEYAEMANCLGVKAVALLDRASRMHSINIVPGVTFVADNAEDAQRSGRALMSEQDIENTISAEPNEKSSKLFDMLAESVSRFFSTHSLQLRVPKSTPADLQRALTEGRGKIKKKLMPFLGVLAVKIFALLPLLLGIVGFLALKALLVGKIALVIAAILALQKYSHSGFSGLGKLTDSFSSSASSYSPVSSPAGYYRRSIEDQAAAQHLAYQAQVPAQETSHS